ncbi:MAG TPA: hypothetical protein VGG33_03175 [Polyangia bacterium]
MGVEVARVAGHPIYAKEVADQSRRWGVAPKQALQQLIDFHALATRAAIDDENALREPTGRRLMVERFLEEEFEPLVTRDKLPEADLRQMYTQFIHTFVHPRLVEVALLSVYTGPNMKPEPRARARETALALHKHVANLPGKPTADDFEGIAKDPTWSGRKVKYWKFFQGPDRPHGPFGKGLGTPIQKLRKSGDMTGLIDDDSGYHIGLFVSETAPKNVPFEVARGEIATGYFPHWRQKRFAEWTKSLSANHQVEVFADRAVAAGGVRPPGSAGLPKP